jgi:hypothetical protein
LRASIKIVRNTAFSSYTHVCYVFYLDIKLFVIMLPTWITAGQSDINQENWT